MTCCVNVVVLLMWFVVLMWRVVILLMWHAVVVVLMSCSVDVTSCCVFLLDVFLCWCHVLLCDTVGFVAFSVEMWRWELVQGHATNKIFFYMGHPRTLFSLFSFFQYSWQLIMFNINFVDDWIRTAGLWYQKWLLYQLSHNHCPPFTSLYTRCLVR